MRSGVKLWSATGPLFGSSPGNNPAVSVTAFTFAPLLSSSFVAATFA